MTRRQLTKQLEHTANHPLQSQYICCNMEDAIIAAAGLARHFSHTIAAAEGIYELIENAIEHGHLGIGGAHKAALYEEGTYDTELALLLENNTKAVHVSIENKILCVVNQDKGFDPNLLTRMDVATLTQLCGRGIYFAQQRLGVLTWSDRGQQVACSVT